MQITDTNNSYGNNLQPVSFKDMQLGKTKKPIFEKHFWL